MDPTHTYAHQVFAEERKPKKNENGDKKNAYMILFILIRYFLTLNSNILIFIFRLFSVWPHFARGCTMRCEALRGRRAKMIYTKIWKGAVPISLYASCVVRSQRRQSIASKTTEHIENWWVIFACAISHYRDEILRYCLVILYFIFFFLSCHCFFFIVVVSFHFVWCMNIEKLEIISLIRSSCYIVYAIWQCVYGSAVLSAFISCAYSTPGDTAIIYIF